MSNTNTDDPVTLRHPRDIHRRSLAPRSAAEEVAELLGLSSRRAVGVYRGRYHDFLAPVMVKGPLHALAALRHRCMASALIIPTP